MSCAPSYVPLRSDDPSLGDLSVTRSVRSKEPCLFTSPHVSVKYSVLRRASTKPRVSTNPRVSTKPRVSAKQYASVPQPAPVYSKWESIPVKLLHICTRCGTFSLINVSRKSVSRWHIPQGFLASRQSQSW